MKILSERSKESKEQKKNKGSVLVAESAYNAQNAQFGLVMTVEIFLVDQIDFSSYPKAKKRVLGNF